MKNIIFDQTVPKDQRITELHVWIAINEDGSEGILSADIPFPGGMTRHCPLLNSKRDVAERLRDQAEMMQKLAELSGTPLKIELRTFTLKT